MVIYCSFKWWLAIAMWKKSRGQRRAEESCGVLSWLCLICPERMREENMGRPHWACLARKMNYHQKWRTSKAGNSMVTVQWWQWHLCRQVAWAVVFSGFKQVKIVQVLSSGRFNKFSPTSGPTFSKSHGNTDWHMLCFCLTKPRIHQQAKWRSARNVTVQFDQLSEGFHKYG